MPDRGALANPVELLDRSLEATASLCFFERVESAFVIIRDLKTSVTIGHIRVEVKKNSRSLRFRRGG